MRRSIWRGWLFGLVAVLVGSAAQAGEAGPLKVGETLENLSFKDIWYLTRSLDDLGQPKAYAIVLVTVDCPTVAAYLPVLKELEERFRPQGVQFLAVNVGPQDSIMAMASQGLKHELKMPFVKDTAQAWAARLGASHTPTAVVLDAQRRLRYRGRIDDRFSQTAQREPSEHDLPAALEAVLAGREVARAETPASGCAIPRGAALSPPANLNFAEHIAPVLAKHCQGCHRPGTEAPFSLVSYDDAAGHAETVAEVVAEGRMPPWYSNFGVWQNAPHMSAEEQALVRAWVAAGCPPGDLSRVPESPHQAPRTSRWAIDEPDLVIKVPQTHELPADGYVPYKYVVLPYRFPHDTWIQQCEILPDNPRVVHHCNMAYLENAFDWKNAKFVLGKVPGVQPMLLEQGVGFRIPKGSVLILQIHYTTTGQPEKCNIEVGMRYARDVIQKEFHFLWMVDTQFAIPPGDPLHRVTAVNVLPRNAMVLGMFAHMHLRGRHMSFFARPPGGDVEKLLEIPNYSFDWQLAYRFADIKRLPKGTEIECVSHYDNSRFNPFNPDPAATVREGQQTFEEMLNGVLFYLDADEQLNLHIDPQTGAVLDQTASTRN